MENRKSCPCCGASVHPLASFCPRCARSVNQRREIKPPWHMPRRLDLPSLVDAPGAAGTEGGQRVDRGPAAGAAFPVFHHSSSIRRSTSR